MLAERTIKSAKPTDKDQFLSDGNGLYCRIAKSGNKTFVYKDQRGGKTKWLTLGTYPSLSLLEARQKAIDIKAGTVEITDMTLGMLCQRYYDHVEKIYKRPEQAVNKLKANIEEPIGHVRLNKLTRAILTTQLERIANRPAPIMANRVMEECKKMLSYAVEKGWTKTNPLDGVTRRVVGGKESSRDVNLSFDEVEDFLKLLQRGNGMDKGTAWALFFCLLTGCRGSEAVWCLQFKTLDVPEEVAKYRTHRIPATPLVKAVLKMAPPPPKYRETLTAAVSRNNCDFTPHDLRRTFASRLSDLGVMPHVIEKLLNHKMEGVMAVYNRAEYWPERITAQKLWDRKLQQLRKKGRGA